MKFSRFRYWKIIKPDESFERKYFTVENDGEILKLDYYESEKRPREKYQLR